MLEVAAGVKLGRAINTAIGRGLSGLESLSGIPGTVGGAIVGNAGAYGQSISDQLAAVEVFDPNVKHSVFNKNVPLWQIVAEHVSKEWNKNNNCMLVAGATYPEELKKIREIVGDMTLLVPGVGAQGGTVGDVMKSGPNSEGLGLIINSSRGIIFASNPKLEAQKLCEEIRKYKK